MLKQCNVSTANLVFESDIRMDIVIWLAGSVLSLDNDAIMEDVILDAADGEKHMHESMSVFQGLPNWARDGDGFCEWIGAAGLFGFIVKVSTPMPTKFYQSGDYMTAGFGYTAVTYLYVDDLRNAASLATQWRNERLKAWRKEMGAPNDPS